MNNLKTINDVYGHQYGDEAIVSLSKSLQRAFSGNSDCYRIGGDEFVCILRKWKKK